MDPHQIDVFRNFDKDYYERARPVAGRARIGVSCEPTWKPPAEPDTIVLMFEAVLAAGGLPCLVSLGYDRDSLEDLDGLIIPGGNDLDPATYGQQPDGTNMDEVQPDFDRFELNLVREVLRREMPYLGTCRGALLLNVAAGGTLFQDLQGGARFTHPGRGARLHTEIDHTCIQEPGHKIFIKAGSRLHEIVGDVSVPGGGVNSSSQPIEHRRVVGG